MILGPIPLEVRRFAPLAARQDFLPMMMLDLDRIITDQQRLNVQQLLRLLLPDAPRHPILVVTYNEKTYLVDGNHRAWLAEFQGEKHILARFANL